MHVFSGAALIWSAARSVFIVPCAPRSLFWNPFNFPDALGEPMGTVMDLNTNSQARTAMITFASTMATRYAEEDAIVAFEFGNEWNLLVRSCLYWLSVSASCLFLLGLHVFVHAMFVLNAQQGCTGMCVRDQRVTTR